MIVKEAGDTFTCDCGFSWLRGNSGAHDCSYGYREQIAELRERLNSSINSEIMKKIAHQLACFDTVILKAHEARGLIDGIAAGRQQREAAEKECAQLRVWKKLAAQRYEKLQDLREKLNAPVEIVKMSVSECKEVSGQSDDYCEGWCAANDWAIHRVKAAGYPVQGE